MLVVGGVGGCVGIGYEGADFGLSVLIFTQKVQYLSCGGSSYNSRWHTPDTQLVLVVAYYGFACPAA